MSVTDFDWQLGAAAVSWIHDGNEVRKQYQQPIVSAVVLRGNDGVALVEPEDREDGRNAVVFDADGAERYRLARLCRVYESCHFAQIYYVRDELTAFVVLRGTDFAFVVDPATGNYLRQYETR